MMLETFAPAVLVAFSAKNAGDEISAGTRVAK